MRIHTVQWNIGGGKICNPNAPLQDRTYDRDGMDHIIGALARLRPDFIALQEAHADGNRIQSREIATALGYRYVANDLLSVSHIEPGQRLSLAIISRWPIDKHKFTCYPRIDLGLRGPDGKPLPYHDKGVTDCEVRLGSTYVNVMTCHSVPFHMFGLDPYAPKFEKLREAVTRHACPRRRGICLGDFNIDEPTLQRYALAPFWLGGVREVPIAGPTRPDGLHTDHVVYSGMTHIESIVHTSVLTDHYLLESQFTF